MKKTFICMLAVVTLFCACNETEIWNERMNSVGTSDDITIEAVKKSALDFINNVQPITRGESFGIASVYAWRSEDMFPTTRGNGDEELPDTALYIVNFTNNNGFMLLSANDPTHEVVAYVEEGNMTPNTTIDNPGFKIFLSGLKDYLSKPDPVKPITPDTTKLEFDSLYTSEMAPEYEGEWRIKSMVPALLSTKWGQKTPYNTYCFTNAGEQSVTGCVAIAGAQLIAYYQYPSSYNGHSYYWSYILDGKEPVSALGKECVARLASDVGILANTQYYPNYASSEISFLKKCWNHMGYTYSSYSSYNYNLCVNEFEQGRPVVIGGYEGLDGPGHCWVLDGYIRRTSYITIHEKEYIYKDQSLVHCNWGWFGKYNGYFLHNCFDLSKRILTDSQKTPTTTASDNLVLDNTLTVFYGLTPE